MSRIGRLPITVPAGVTVNVAEGNRITVKGPKGELSEKVSAAMAIEQEGNIITVKRPNDEKQNRAQHGLARTLINNMVVGVTEGFAKTLVIEGVGYRAVKNGSKLTLSLGYSHPIEFEEEKNITIEVPAPNRIIVKGISKQRVGELAANIRIKRPPEPYLGKGIRYENEHVRRKAGKSGK